MSAAACKVKNKTEKQKRTPTQMWYFSTKHFETPVATVTMKSGVLWSEADNTQQLIVKHCQHPNLYPFPSLQAVALSHLRGSWEALTD